MPEGKESGGNGSGSGGSGSGGSGGENRSGEGDSSRALWRALRAFFRGPDQDQSLRAQIEEAIEEHEDGPGNSSGGGDLVPI